MKIASIECFAIRVPLKPECQMITALGVHDVSDYVVLRLLTDDGAEGVGEATVSERWSGETTYFSNFIARSMTTITKRC